MREYNNDELTMIKCNACGKELKVLGGVLQEGCFHVDYPWGYFSRKDGVIHQFDLCENCYDQWIHLFRIPIEEKEMNEFL